MGMGGNENPAFSQFPTQSKRISLHSAYVHEKNSNRWNEILVWEWQGMGITDGTGNKTWLILGVGIGMGMNQ